MLGRMEIAALVAALLLLVAKGELVRVNSGVSHPSASLASARWSVNVTIREIRVYADTTKLVLTKTTLYQT